MKVTITLDHTTLLEAIDQYLRQRGQFLTAGPAILAHSTPDASDPRDAGKVYYSATIHATLKPPPLVTAKGDPQR